MSSVTALCDDCFERFVESLVGLSQPERDQALLGFDSDRQATARAFLLIADEHGEPSIEEHGLIEIASLSEEGDD